MLTVLWVSSAQTQDTPQHGQPRGLCGVTGHVPEPQGQPQHSSQQKRAPGPSCQPSPTLHPRPLDLPAHPILLGPETPKPFLVEQPLSLALTSSSAASLGPQGITSPQPQGGVRLWMAGRSWGAFLSTCFWVT